MEAAVGRWGRLPQAFKDPAEVGPVVEAHLIADLVYPQGGFDQKLGSLVDPAVVDRLGHRGAGHRLEDPAQVIGAATQFLGQYRC